METCDVGQMRRMISEMLKDPQISPSRETGSDYGTIISPLKVKHTPAPNITQSFRFSHNNVFLIKPYRPVDRCADKMRNTMKLIQEKILWPRRKEERLCMLIFLSSLIGLIGLFVFALEKQTHESSESLESLVIPGSGSLGWLFLSFEIGCVVSLLGRIGIHCYQKKKRMRNEESEDDVYEDTVADRHSNPSMHP